MRKTKPLIEDIVLMEDDGLDVAEHEELVPKMKGTKRFSRLRYEYTDDRKWMLYEPLIFFHASCTIVVPAKFKTDLDSVPRVPIVYAVFKGRAVKSAIAHDYLYGPEANEREKLLGKSFADRIFLDGMKAEGLPRRWRYPIYWAVVVFGGSRYQKRKLEEV